MSIGGLKVILNFKKYCFISGVKVGHQGTPFTTQPSRFQIQVIFLQHLGHFPNSFCQTTGDHRNIQTFHSMSKTCFPHHHHHHSLQPLTMHSTSYQESHSFSSSTAVFQEEMGSWPSVFSLSSMLSRMVVLLSISPQCTVSLNLSSLCYLFFFFSIKFLTTKLLSGILSFCHCSSNIRISISLLEKITLAVITNVKISVI